MWVVPAETVQNRKFWTRPQGWVHGMSQQGLPKAPPTLPRILTKSEFDDLSFEVAEI